MAEVIVVGAGPVGMLVAGQLARLGVDVQVLEQRAQAGGGSRAIGVHAPVLAALEDSGVTERLLAGAVRVSRGQARARGAALGEVRFDRLSMRFPFVATLPQSATEAAISADAPTPERGVRVVAVRPQADRVEVVADQGGTARELTATVVIVATGGGGRHLVFRPGGVPVHAYGDGYLMTDVPASGDETCALVHLDPLGVLESFPLPGGIRRFVAWDTHGGGGAGYSDADDARAERLRSAIRQRAQDPAAADAVSSATAFTVRRAVAPRLRRGRVVVIGDAAHEVSPIGGQGMNLGLLDAVSLAPLVAHGVRCGVLPERELSAWEHRRVASARISARLATANTVLGRPRGIGGDRLRRAVVRAMLAPPAGGVFARAYAMGFDRDA